MLELGPREVELLAVLWSDGEATANEVYDRLQTTRVTVNTIHSALERLYRKGFVARAKQGRSFVYRPTLTRDEVICQCLRVVAERLAGNDNELMMDAIAAYLRSDGVVVTARARQRLLRCLY